METVFAGVGWIATSTSVGKKISGWVDDQIQVAEDRLSSFGRWVRGARTVHATAELAEEIQRKGFPTQTIVLLETKQGKTIVAGQPDLSEAQKTLARERGLLIADDWPGIHAELTAISFAGTEGLIPTRGVLTSQMCDEGENNCFDQICEWLAESEFALRLDSGKKEFDIIRRKLVQ